MNILQTILQIPIHPQLVHFPVSMMFGAGLFIIISLFFSKNEVFKEVFFWMMTVGIAGIIAAIISGLMQEDSLVQNHEIHEIMELHEKLGFIIASIFGVLYVWALLRRKKMQKKEHFSMAALMFLVCILLGYSANLGGKLVYQHGAGVEPMKEIIKAESFIHEEND